MFETDFEGNLIRKENDPNKGDSPVLIPGRNRRNYLLLYTFAHCTKGREAFASPVCRLWVIVLLSIPTVEFGAEAGLWDAGVGRIAA